MARFSALDFCRFIAAFGVVLLHFTEVARYSPYDGFGGAVSQFYLFVDFFFILSGFVIGLTYFDRVATSAQTFEFLRRRIARIYPMYLLTLAIYLIPAMVGRSDNPDKYNIASILQDVFMVSSWQPNPRLPFNFPAWSISVEWAMYLFFPLIALLCRKLGLSALLVLILGGFIANEAMIASKEPHLWFLSITPIRAVPTFAIGVLISRTAGKFNFPFGYLVGFFAFLSSIAMIVLHLNVYLVVATFSIAIFATASDKDGSLFEGAIFRWLGDASYSLYMLHSLTVVFVVKVAWPYLAINQPPIWLGFLAAVATTCLAILSFMLFEKPARDLISGRRSIPRIDGSALTARTGKPQV